MLLLNLTLCEFDTAKKMKYRYYVRNSVLECSKCMLYLNMAQCLFHGILLYGVRIGQALQMTHKTYFCNTRLILQLYIKQGCLQYMNTTGSPSPFTVTTHLAQTQSGFSMDWNHQLINCNPSIRHTATNKRDVILFQGAHWRDKLIVRNGICSLPVSPDCG